MKLLNFSKKQLYTLLAVSTFFLIITAQFFWATIHGDGAVYAWLTRQVTEFGVFSARPLQWSATTVFADHPYFFFYVASVFTRVLGFSDLVLKIPNFLIAGLSVWTVYRVAVLRDGQQERSYQIGLVAGYVLLLNAAYGLQISQPTLDPLEQLLGYAAVLILIYKRQAFGAGFLLGLAFMIKGLELLPNLAGLFLLTYYLDYRNFKQLLKNLLLGFFGLLIPIGVWLGHDHFAWNGEWLQTYISRQFQNRLLSESNMKSFISFDYVWTFLRVYLVEIFILLAGLLKSVRSRKADPLFFYFVCYLFFHLLAFMIIKKDSSQHLTGVLLVGSVFVAEYLWEGLQKLNRRFLRALPATLFLMALIYWCYYQFHKNDKTDLWTSIKNESVTAFAQNEEGLPLVIKDSSTDVYGLFNTVQWYFPKYKVYLQNEADQLLVGKEVYLLSDSEGWKVTKEKSVYKKGAL